MLKKILLLLLLGSGLATGSDAIKIAAAAGYKKPLMEILKAYHKHSGSEIYAIFGNMKQISVQAKHTDIALLIGDKKYLANKSNMSFIGFETLGAGRLALVYPKGRKIATFNDLAGEEIKTIAMPHPSKTIYGIAADEFLKRSELYEKTEEKLRIVATLPQVATYLVANEVDAGLMDLTAALVNETKIGGYLLIPQERYSKIEIVAGRLSGCTKNGECQNFIDFLHTNQAKEIFKRYGL